MGVDCGFEVGVDVEVVCCVGVMELAVGEVEKLSECLEVGGRLRRMHHLCRL